MSSSEDPSFATDIRPLFRPEDRDAMLFAFDLWSHDDVAVHADAILEAVQEGWMPCDEEWGADDVSRLEAWIAAGKPA